MIWVLYGLICKGPSLNLESKGEFIRIFLTKNYIVLIYMIKIIYIERDRYIE